ncbi:hypothetical protein Tco_1275499 [Tanacetum coccineum]
MYPLTAQQERKTRKDYGKDYGTKRGRPSTYATSSSAFGQPSSSHHIDDDNDGNNKGTSRASTPSPTRFVNSLSNDIPQVFSNPPHIDPNMEAFYTRQTKILNHQVWSKVNRKGHQELVEGKEESNTTAKLPILKLGEYEMWVIRIKQYFQALPMNSNLLSVNYNDAKTMSCRCQKPVLEALDIIVSSGAQNLAFMTAPSTSSTNDVNTANPAYEVSTVSPNINTACPQDLEQIHKDDLEAIDLKWQLSLLKCFNCHKMEYFARECRAPRNKEGQFRNQDNTRKQGNNEDTSSKAMLAIDGVAATYKRGLATLEEQLITYRKNEVLFSEEVAVLKREGKPQQDDTRFIDSGCSRHMTGNIAYLSDFKEFDGGYITFGGGESKTSRHVKRGRNTKIPQSSGPPIKVGDEAVHKELGDSIGKRVATNASRSRCRAGLCTAGLKVSTVRLKLVLLDDPTARTTNDGEVEITATIDGQVKTINEETQRRHLKLEDSDGITSLPNTDIFEQLALMGVDFPLFPTMITAPESSPSRITSSPSLSPQTHQSSPLRDITRQADEIPQS